MPLKGVRYRTKGKGKNRIRYALRGSKVVEVKHFSSGQTHMMSRDEREKDIHTQARRKKRRKR